MESGSYCPSSSLDITALLKHKLTLLPYQSNLAPLCSHMENSAVVKLTFLPLPANFIQLAHEVYCIATQLLAEKIGAVAGRGMERNSLF